VGFQLSAVDAPLAIGRRVLWQQNLSKKHGFRSQIAPRLYTHKIATMSVTQSVAFDMTRQGEGQHLERTAGGGIVRAYTDLKRHNLCDAPDHPNPIRFFCNERLADGRPDQDCRSEFFLTRKLWDVGNSRHRTPPWRSHPEAIPAHGDEARPARDTFDDLPPADQAAIVKFLKPCKYCRNRDCGVEAAPLVPPAARPC
jgi:hypothetical protein